MRRNVNLDRDWKFRFEFHDEDKNQLMQDGEDVILPRTDLGCAVVKVDSDVFRNQNYPIVFVTVMFVLPFFLKLHYSFNVVILFAGTIWLCIEKSIYHGFTIGYTSNNKK